MNKDAIKVVKRNKKDGTKKLKAVVNAPEIECDNQLKIVNVINNWISERRENSRVEKVFSDNKILGWKFMSKNF